MLIRFGVENFRSIHGAAELSMVAIDEERPDVRRSDTLGASLLTAAGIFGPNASGKSNILAALAWLRSALETSLRQWDETIPVEPFAFGDGPVEDTSFSLELLMSGVRFEYLVELNSRRVGYEALFHYPEGRRRRVFERDGNALTLQRGLGVLAGTRALLTDRSLALSIMRRFDEPLTSSFSRDLLRTVCLGQPLERQRRFGRSLHPTVHLFEPMPQEQLALFDDDFDEPSPTRDQAMALLRLADLGVVDVKLEKAATSDLFPGGTRRVRPQLVHASEQEQVAFDFHDESAGTRAWFELIGPVLTALKSGSLVLFDELDASLHPTLTARLVRLFQGRSSNSGGAQLLFTSHDTNLLNYLNRDEVWLTEKDANGETRFAALSDFAGERVRRSQNIESGYLSGRFGALPDVTRPAVLRELGLIG